MPQVFLMDPSLEGEMSHHYYAASALLHELEALRIPVTVLGHHQASATVRQLPCHPHFRIGGYYHRPGPGREVEVEATSVANAVIFNDLLRLNRAGIQRQDYVFFPAMTSNQVLAACQWIATFPPGTAPHFGMCLMFQPNWNPQGRTSDVGEGFYRAGFPFIPPALWPRLTTTCETAALADEYRELLGVSPRVQPIPTLQHLIEPGAHRVDPEYPRLSFLGYAKPEKGIDLLPEIIARVHAARPKAHFTVQLMSHDPSLLDRVRRQLTDLNCDIVLIEGAIGPPRMVEVLSESSLALLPYDNRTYRTRGSAIFSEAKAVGVPMVLPDQTAIGEEGSDLGLATTFAAFTAASVATATVAALDRLRDLSAAANAASRKVAETWSGYLEPLMAQAGALDHRSAARPRRSAAAGSTDRPADTVASRRPTAAVDPRRNTAAVGASS